MEEEENSRWWVLCTRIETVDAQAVADWITVVGDSVD